MEINGVQMTPEALQRMAEKAQPEDGIQEPRMLLESDSEYECSRCHDTGLVILPDGDTARRCECMERKRMNKLLRDCNVSEEFTDRTFENFDIEGADQRVVDAYNIAKQYSGCLIERLRGGQGLKGAPWMGLLGTAGSGKTHLATAAALPLLHYRVSPLFFNWVQNFQEWMAYHTSQEESHKVDEIRQRLYTCELLIVDDVCKESQKDVWIREFYGIVDYRYRHKLPLIFTSEYFSELIGFLSKAVAGRLFEKTYDKQTKKSYLGNMTLAADDDPLALDYRFKRFLP